jgi:hypothetical protein
MHSFEDIDYSIRELGIGDNSVPKRMKKLAGMFYGRLEAYSKAMDADRCRQPWPWPSPQYSPEAADADRHAPAWRTGCLPRKPFIGAVRRVDRDRFGNAAAVA